MWAILVVVTWLVSSCKNPIYSVHQHHHQRHRQDKMEFFSVRRAYCNIRFGRKNLLQPNWMFECWEYYLLLLCKKERILRLFLRLQKSSYITAQADRQSVRQCLNGWLCRFAIPPPHHHRLRFFVSLRIQINHKTFSHHSSVPEESELNLIIYATSYFCLCVWSLNPSQSPHSLTW